MKQFVLILAGQLLLSVIFGVSSCGNGEKADARVVLDEGAGAVIVLYEGNNATKDVVCNINLPSSKSTAHQQEVGLISFAQANNECTINDEARSLVLKEAKAGMRIYLYDEEDCDQDDSTTLIVVKNDVDRKVIGTFEENFSDSDVTVNILKGGNLDGKLSCIGRWWW